VLPAIAARAGKCRVMGPFKHNVKDKDIYNFGMNEEQYLSTSIHNHGNSLWWSSHPKKRVMSAYLVIRITDEV
jgi:hypothetical protein